MDSSRCKPTRSLPSIPSSLKICLSLVTGIRPNCSFLLSNKILCRILSSKVEKLQGDRLRAGKMILSNKPPTEITWEDLENLVGRAKETESFEVKSEPPDSSSKDNREFCRDACAMLNRGGGHIIYGLKEDSKTRLVSEITDFKFKGFPERLEQILVSSLTPTPVFKIIPISKPSDASSGCILLWFPRNLHEPFMVIRDGENRYWVRHNVTKLKMGEREVSEAYQRRNQMYDKLENYLASKSYGSMDDPNAYEPWASVLTIPVPFDEQLFSVNDPTIRDFLKPSNHPSRTGYNIGNILPDAPVIKQRRFECRLPDTATRLAETAYLNQVYDNGCIIHARKWRGEGDPPNYEIHGQFFCAVIYDGLTLAESLYSRFVQSGQVVICANLSRSSGTYLSTPFDYRGFDQVPLDYQIETMRRENTLIEFLDGPGLIAKSIADEFYNSYGISGAPCIDDEGQWHRAAQF